MDITYIINIKPLHMNKYSQKGSHTPEASRTFRLWLTRLESVLFENEIRRLNDFVDNRGRDQQTREED